MTIGHVKIAEQNKSDRSRTSLPLKTKDQCDYVDELHSSLKIHSNAKVLIFIGMQSDLQFTEIRG